MPAVLTRTIVRTAENAFLLMAKYQKEETATEAEEKVEQLFKTKAKHIHEVINLHRLIME